MKKLLVVFAITILTWLAFPAHADDYDDLRTKMTAARQSLIAMMLHKDRRGNDQQMLVKSTADAVSAQLAIMKSPTGKEAKFKELNETWNAFKKTRETVLVPAILNGIDEEARKIAGGIQKERLARCNQLIKELGGNFGANI